MLSSLALKNAPPTKQPYAYKASAGAPESFELSGKDEAEALDFLAKRPLQTVFMSGLIRDNGIVSALNRGTFYASRDAYGEITGVALIGHATIIEARTPAALKAFAHLTQNNRRATHLILGESVQISGLWQLYAGAGRRARRICREALLEQRYSTEEHEVVHGLRCATLADLAHVMPVQAQMAFTESTVNPMDVDPLGFRLRCARRIEQDRVWVWIEDGRLRFKADIMADTHGVIYLEGIYVAPEDRGKGYGLRCLSQVSRNLLLRAQSVCLLVNEHNQPALNFYRRAGFKLRNHFDMIYLQQP